MSTSSINLGKIIITPRGAWSSQEEYKRLDLIYAIDGSYIALKDNKGVNVTDSSTWQMVAGRGPAGSGNVSVVETGLKTGKKYFFIPSADNSAEGTFQEYTPETFNQQQADWNQTQTDRPDFIKNKPELFSGDYNNLTNKPKLFSGNYNDLANRPVSLPANGGHASTAIESSNSEKLGGKTYPTSFYNWSEQLGYYQELNLSELDDSIFYPCTCVVPRDEFTKYEINVKLNTNIPSWASNASGFSLYLRWEVNACSWNSAPVTRNIFSKKHYYVRDIVCGGVDQMVHSSTEIVWLRGGGIYKLWKSTANNFTIRTEDYTTNNQTVKLRTLEEAITGWHNMKGEGNVLFGDVYANNFYGKSSDSEKLEGKPVSDFLVYRGSSSNIDSLDGIGLNTYTSNTSGILPDYTFGTIIQFGNMSNLIPGTDGHWITQMAFPAASGRNVQLRRRINTLGWEAWRTFLFKDDPLYSFMSGSKTITSLASLVLDKQINYANLSSNQSISVSSKVIDGQPAHIYVTNTAATDIIITIPTTGSYVTMSGASKTVPVGGYIEISIAYDANISKYRITTLESE